MYKNNWLRHQQSGFTLVEMMITVFMIAVLLGIAVPSYQNFIANQRVKTFSFELYTTMVQARSEAIKRNATVYVRPSGAGWSGGWAITTDNAKGYAACVADATDCYKVVDPDNSITIVVNSDGTNAPGEFAFNRQGRLLVAGGAVSMCDNLTTTSTKPYFIDFSLIGRASLTKSDINGWDCP